MKLKDILVQELDPVRIRESQRAGRTIERSNEVSIYKPYINRGSDRGAPRTFENSRQRSQNVITDRNVARQERPYQNRGNQQIERQQFPNQNDQRVERQQVPDQNNRRVERPYQNRGNQQVEGSNFLIRMIKEWKDNKYLIRIIKE
jgi:hypothetical protein